MEFVISVPPNVRAYWPNLLRLLTHRSVSWLLVPVTPFAVSNTPSPRNSPRRTYAIEMNSFVGLSLVLTVVVVATLSGLAAGADVNICSNVADNVFLTDVTDCQKYYICVNGTAISQVCRENLYFNAATQACETDSTHCLTCNPNNLTITALQRTCNKYVICFSGTPVIQECADDLQFSVAEGVCDIPFRVNCVENRCAISDSATDIVYVPSYNNCSNYYICMNGFPWEQNCASGLIFNANINRCDRADNYNCTIVKTRRSSAVHHHNVSPARIVDIDCPATGTHMYPHIHSNEYYMCVNGHGALLTCAEGLFYDKQAETCRELKNIVASSD